MFFSGFFTQEISKIKKFYLKYANLHMAPFISFVEIDKNYM